MKPATSNLASSLVCQSQSSNPTRRKSGCGLGLGELPDSRGFPFNISATAEVSDFKFGEQLGFAKAHHKITPRGKSKGGLGLGELPKILGLPFIFATAGASDFTFGAQLGFAKAYHKITRRKKGGRNPGLKELYNIWGSPSIFTQWLKLATSDLVHSLGLPRPIITITPIEKSGHGLGLAKLPYIWCSPLIFLQRPRCPLSVSGASYYFYFTRDFLQTRSQPNFSRRQG